MANPNGWNDDRRAYGGEDYDVETRRSQYRSDREVFGGPSPYDRGPRSEGPSYARSDWRNDGFRNAGPQDHQTAERYRGYDPAHERQSRSYGARPVSDYAYGAGGGWDHELTGAYSPVDEGRYEPSRYGRDHDRDLSRQSRFGSGPATQFDGPRFAGGRTQEHRGRGPKDYKRSDERIREDVNDRLTDDPQLDASGVTVSVKDAEVTLTGTVQERGDKRRAEDLTDHVSGVRHVQNNLRVHDSNYNAATASAGGGAQSVPTSSTGRGVLS